MSLGVTTEFTDQIPAVVADNPFGINWENSRKVPTQGQLYAKINAIPLGVMIGDEIGGATQHRLLATGAGGTLTEIVLNAGQSVRKNLSNTGLEAYTPFSGVGSPVNGGSDNGVFFQSGGNFAQSANLTFANNALTVNGCQWTKPNSTSLFFGSSPHGSYSGSTNLFIGLLAGAGNTDQYGNCFVGHDAGSGTSGDAYFNSFFGTSAGKSASGRNNTLLGYAAGNNVTSGAENTLIGASSGVAIVTGSYNTLIGRNAGSSLTGSYGVAVGYSAGSACTSGSENTFLGLLAGYQTTTGSNSVFVGSRSGKNGTTGNNNCAIGFNVDLPTASGSYQTNVNDTFIATDTLAWIESGRKFGLNTNSPTAFLDVNSDIIRIRNSKTPISSTASGNAGDICWDSNYIYIAVANNTWKRVSLSTW